MHNYAVLIARRNHKTSAIFYSGPPGSYTVACLETAQRTVSTESTETLFPSLRNDTAFLPSWAGRARSHARAGQPPAGARGAFRQEEPTPFPPNSPHPSRSLDISAATVRYLSPRNSSSSSGQRELVVCALPTAHRHNKRNRIVFGRSIYPNISAFSGKLTPTWCRLPGRITAWT